VAVWGLFQIASWGVGGPSIEDLSTYRSSAHVRLRQLKVTLTTVPEPATWGGASVGIALMLAGDGTAARPVQGFSGSTVLKAGARLPGRTCAAELPDTPARLRNCGAIGKSIFIDWNCRLQFEISSGGSTVERFNGPANAE